MLCKHLSLPVLRSMCRSRSVCSCWKEGTGVFGQTGCYCVEDVASADLMEYHGILRRWRSLANGRVATRGLIRHSSLLAIWAMFSVSALDDGPMVDPAIDDRHRCAVPAGGRSGHVRRGGLHASCGTLLLFRSSAAPALGPTERVPRRLDSDRSLSVAGRSDPRVTAAMAKMHCEKYREGIMTYRNGMHGARIPEAATM